MLNAASTVFTITPDEMTLLRTTLYLHPVTKISLEESGKFLPESQTPLVAGP